MYCEISTNVIIIIAIALQLNQLIRYYDIELYALNKMEKNLNIC